MDVFAVVLLLASSVVPCRADYPDRGIKVYVAWPPGGSTDLVGRFVAEQLSAVFKQPVVVENRSGANGNVGAEMFAKLPADGYALMVATAETHAINPYVYKKIGYDAAKDFDPIALLARVDFVLVARSGLDVRTVNDFVRMARASPGKLTVGSYGIGSTSHLALAALEERTSTSYLHVPYRGLSPAVNAILTGEIDGVFVSPNSVAGFDKSGQAKVLGSASARRPAIVADVPTFAEQGIPDFVSGNWYGIVAPKGLPAEVRRRLETELGKIGNSSQFAQRAEPTGIVIDYRDANGFAAFMKEENARWRKIVESQKIGVDQ